MSAEWPKSTSANIIATNSGGTELTFTRGGGTDILFTMSVNTSTETVTVTSDKTYSELVNYLNVPIIIDLYVDGEHSDYLPGRSYMTYADHKTFDVYGGGSSIMAIEYYSNGNIVFLEKSPMMITLTATQNGTYTPTANLNLYDEVIVTVPTGTPRTASDLTVSGATVTVPAGLYSAQASKAVASGTAGTPTATKGTASNHSVTVTPSVTNTTGYITGSTKTGTAVTVSASELVSGSETKTANGTYDVTNLAELVVNVSGGSSKNVQTAQSTTRATSSTYTEVITLTCTKAGTYHVYWSTFRSSTSGTWGSQLYLNDTAYGTAETGSWSNHIQNIHLTNVQITANAEVAVRVRTRGSNYYGYVGTLTIIEA
ncbi:MAG: hypothetical protein K6F23_03190 [Solobacterium sp.]|nr:hypothetical protein [Solobacterium sp.]